MVLLSPFLQIVLVIFSNRRKYTVKPWIRILIWSAYLSADWVATVALRVLSNSHGDLESELQDPNYTLMAFWAPFLLLHLGGPDTITAYSLEDNELWLRHLLGLLVQVAMAFYVFFRSWARTPLTFLSIPMFVARIIKYGERTWVLRSASKNQFRDSMLPPPDPEPDYAGFMEKTSSDTRFERSTDDDYFTNPSGKSIDKAYFLFKEQFRHLYSGLILSFNNQTISNDIIGCMSYDMAIEIVEMELSFMYDVLYTKAPVVYSLLGVSLRSISFFSIVCTLIFFCFTHKHRFSSISINITYILLSGAIFFKIYALITLILSDWSIAWLSNRIRSRSYSIFPSVTSFPAALTSEKRWSRSMAQRNLIDYCLRDKTKFDHFPRFFDMNKFLERYWHTTWKNVDDIKKPIFMWLLEMTNIEEDLM